MNIPLSVKRQKKPESSEELRLLLKIKVEIEREFKDNEISPKILITQEVLDEYTKEIERDLIHALINDLGLDNSFTKTVSVTLEKEEENID